MFYTFYTAILFPIVKFILIPLFYIFHSFTPEILSASYAAYASGCLEYSL